ncbi:flavodoxin family protein [Goodfellowiella coeruleoviolacea]|uniref:Multimeric flavodoxin WrbA n=1 Tax=Goodfellowiella coeruleoviolacea TaxID=334858 RepID=A0AAE3GL68_9PSEU|nr:flavodoxin family protein [Goodfellowiella coeruleoviolacea]MCP2169329.1 Multimeric flavodoxin WrbA [Goodfellowiella coeruleoviolacea]
MTHTELPPVRVLAISGSERAGGNTDQVLDYAAELAARYGARLSVLALRDHHIVPCGQCGDCNARGAPCLVRDDVAALVERMCAADAVIYAVPVHGFGPAQLMQTFIERSGVGYLRFHRPLANKVGGAVVVCRRYNDMQVHHQLLLNMLLNRMLVVGSGFPAVLRGGAHDRPLADTEGVCALDRMIERMVGMVRLLRSASPEQLRWLARTEDNERHERTLPAPRRAPGGTRQPGAAPRLPEVRP